jgi:hypothetical protein
MIPQPCGCFGIHSVNKGIGREQENAFGTVGEDSINSGDKLIDMSLLVNHILYERMYLPIGQRIELQCKRM